MANIAWNYLTKGIINSLPMLKYLVVRYEIITPTKVIKGGGGYGEFIDDIYGVGVQHIDAIKVMVDWRTDYRKKKKKITVKQLKKSITAELLRKYGINFEDFELELMSNKGVTVELLKDSDKT